MKTNMHQNSLNVYTQMRDKLKGRKALIVSYFEKIKHPVTDRQCLGSLFPYTDNINMVQPRITELIGLGILREVGKHFDEATKATVRMVELNAEPQAQLVLGGV